MCGIFAIFHSSQPVDQLRTRSLQLSRRLRHRGPDWSGIHIQTYSIGTGSPQLVHNVLAHERLAIVDPDNGAQPLFSDDRKRVLTVNGEIYNHRQLRSELSSIYNFSTGSDCETILALYEYFDVADRSTSILEPLEQKWNQLLESNTNNETVDSIDPSDWNSIENKFPTDSNDLEASDSLLEERILNRLDGVFAFVLIDESIDYCFAARDPFGVCPLYVGWGTDGSMWFASEFKALHEDCVRFREFPPGHYYSSKTGSFVRYYKPKWLTMNVLPTRKYDGERLRQVIEQSVIKRLMCDVPYGVLLSGGLDSSLIAALVCRHAAKRVEDNEQSNAWYPRVHTFSVGLKGSPDLSAARKVANYLETIHHECVFDIQQALDAVRDVIYHVETYDVTTIRASTPMYLLTRLVKANGIKMLLSGEGADEAFAGYLYFHHAPNAAELHAECRRKLIRLSRFDCLRANQAPAAFGVEVRVPFLDRSVICEAMSIDPNIKLVRDDLDSDDPLKDRRKIEKFALRAAFADCDPPLLPDEVLWRAKEQFSDGVGYGWIDALKDFASTAISDQQMASAVYLYPHNTPVSKEAFLYRKWYEELFPSHSAPFLVPGGPSIACSTETAVRWRKEWANQADPSGRAVADVHPSAF